MEKNEIRDKELQKDLSVELYKSLRGEVAGYIEKVPAIWLQKLTLVGALAGFLVVNIEKLGDASKDGLLSPLGAAIMAIPVLAVLLDVKVAEYALHSRIISRFIKASFENPTLAAWESTLWGDRGEKDVRLRSCMTGFVTTTPTILVIVLTWIGLGKAYKSEVPMVYAVGLILLLLFYVSGGFFIWREIWPNTKK